VSENIRVAEPITIVEYDSSWPAQFAELEARIGAALGELAVRIEHVGSTSVEGLPAKPIIDLDVVISGGVLPTVIDRLRGIGYRHEGDLGVTGREAFTIASSPLHHLYVCQSDSRELARHIEFRNFLRTHPGAASAYAKLKRNLAQRFGADRDAYTQAKGDFIERILSDAERMRSERQSE
jgi:GrpB-like predicted nucleotidyltransferase (UPF0157 family)